MEDTQLYITLQGAVERSKGAATWTDVRLALMRAKEAKIQQQLDSVFEGLSLDELMRAEKLADKEVFVKATPPPAAKKAK